MTVMCASTADRFVDEGGVEVVLSRRIAPSVLKSNRNKEITEAAVTESRRKLIRYLVINNSQSNKAHINR